MVNQAKDLCLGITIPVEGLNPFESTLDEASEDDQGAASHSEDA